MTYIITYSHNYNHNSLPPRPRPHTTFSQRSFQNSNTLVYPLYISRASGKLRHT